MVVAVIIYYNYYVIIPLIIAIQILYVPERQYWVATSYMDAELKRYDSMFTGELTPSLEEQLVRIYILTISSGLIFSHHCCLCATAEWKDRLWFVRNCFCSSHSDEEQFQDNLF